MIPQWHSILQYVDKKLVDDIDSSKNLRDCKLYEDILKYTTQDEECRVYECKLVENHEGMAFPTASIVHRYKVTGTCYKKPYVTEIIVKIRKDHTDRSKLRMGLLYHNELNAYTSILPKLDRFCEDRLPSPYVYYARKNIIMMELLGNECYYPVHRSVQGFKPQYCEPVLKSLAKFHSASFVCKHKAPLILKDLAEKPKEVMYYHRQALIVDYMEQYFERLIQKFEKEVWSDENASIIATLSNIRKNFAKQLKELIYTKDKYDVICHGDLRVDNILIKNDFEDAKFIDFQQICYSSVARDLVTLFYVNLKPEELHNSTKDYLKSYWNHLHAYLKRQEINLENVLTEEWLAQEMKRFQLYGVVFGLWHITEFYIDNRTKKMPLNNLSKHKSETDFENGFYLRAKSILLYYIKQVPLDEQIVVNDEEAINEEHKAHNKLFSDEKPLSADEGSKDNNKPITHAEAEVTDGEGGAKNKHIETSAQN